MLFKLKTLITKKVFTKYRKSQKELIKEGEIIIEKLLSKKDFGSSSNYDEVLSEKPI